MSGHQPYSQLQRNLTLSSWVNIFQVTILSVLILFFLSRHPSITRLEQVTDLTTSTQTQLLIVEEKLSTATDLIGQMERQLRELSSQVAGLQR